MFRLLALLGAFTLYAAPSLGETVLGRNYVLFDGRSDTSQPAPLVIAMHGFLSSANNIRKKTGFNHLATRHGFIVAYPNGKARRWNDGRSPRNRTDDVAFVSAMIAKLVASGHAKPHQVFVAGHSNGGGMAMRMACERPDLLRGISVVASKIPSNFQCRNGAPVPALFFHGTQDPIAPHAGRSSKSRLGGTLSASETLSVWQARNGCTQARRRQTIDQKDDGTSAVIMRYTKCRAALEYVLIEGHGHGWPTPNGRPTRLQGPATQEIDATALSWAFFQTL